MINRKKKISVTKMEENQPNGFFCRCTKEMATKRKSLKRKTEALSIATQKNAIRTNYSEAKIDEKQQKTMYMLCGDR